MHPIVEIHFFSQQKQMKPVQKLVLFILFLFLINFIVAGMMTQIESVNYTDAFYLTMTTTTLCGAIPAKTNTGKWFFSFYQYFAYGYFFYILHFMTLLDH